ncbi:MAG TPA: geranylgeranyl reductase family protein [Dehalococcoidia bacterium]|nr:geranylgeranyl reductase family protein [Dehalococcoidia bacterium]
MANARAADFEVAVVGAGPAGATAARGLAAAGARVALIERARLPRYKSCAGGIPLRTAALLPPGVDSVVEDSVRGLNVSYLGRGRFTRWSRRPFALMVMRDRFDNFLAESAAEAGAEVLAGSPVSAVERDGAGFMLTVGGQRLSSRFVIGADGANSGVARAAGLGAGLAQSVALEAEVCGRPGDLDRWRGTVNIDFGYRPWGYGWVFPKQARLSIGLVLPPGGGPDLRSHLQVYLGRLGLADAEIERVVGHKLLFRRGREPIAGDGVLLAGDAAGLADEFTEEGIYYAVRSGGLAAQAVLRALGAGQTSLVGYERAIDRLIMPELRAARRIAIMFYLSLRRATRPMLWLSERVSYFWNAFFRIQQGASSYDRELRRAFWLRPFLSLVDRAALG